MSDTELCEFGNFLVHDDSNKAKHVIFWIFAVSKGQMFCAGLIWVDKSCATIQICNKKGSHQKHLFFYGGIEKYYMFAGEDTIYIVKETQTCLGFPGVSVDFK